MVGGDGRVAVEHLDSIGCRPEVLIRNPRRHRSDRPGPAGSVPRLLSAIAGAVGAGCRGVCSGGFTGGRPQRSGEVHRLSTWSATSNSHGFPSCCAQATWRRVEAMASPLLSRARIERASHVRRHRSTLRQLDRRWLERGGWRTTLEFRENHIRSIEGRLLGTESMWVAEAEFEGRVIAAIERSESRAWARLVSIASA
jgi:hypothetical protein